MGRIWNDMSCAVRYDTALMHRLSWQFHVWPLCSYWWTMCKHAGLRACVHSVPCQHKKITVVTAKMKEICDSSGNPLVLCFKVVGPKRFGTNYSTVMLTCCCSSVRSFGILGGARFIVYCTNQSTVPQWFVTSCQDHIWKMLPKGK